MVGADRRCAGGDGSRVGRPAADPPFLEGDAQVARSGADSGRAGTPSAAREARDTFPRLHPDWLSSTLEARLCWNKRVRPSISCYTLDELCVRFPYFEARHHLLESCTPTSSRRPKAGSIRSTCG